MIKWRGESLVGVFALAPCFSDDCILYECWGGFRAVCRGTSFFFTLLALSLLYHCNKTRVYFLFGDMATFYMNVIIYKYFFDEMLFFYDVISSKFACGFFRLAILKFKLLTCN